MKLTICLLVFAIASNSWQSCCAASENEIRFSENSVIHLLFDMFRGLIINGDSEKAVPKCDPYIIEVGQFPLKGSFLNAEINIKNGVVTGLGRFRLEKFSFSAKDVSLNVELTIPTLKFEADHYEFHGNLFDAIPLSGSGTFYVKANDIVLNTKIYFKQSDDGKAVLIDHLENTDFSIGKIVSLTQYDKNIDHILNAIIEDTLAAKLTRFSRHIAGTYQSHLVAAFNPMMGMYETWSILATLL